MIGRLATMEGARSVGAYVREMLEDRLAEAHSAGAELVRDARQLLLPLAMCLVVGFGLGFVLAASLAGANELRTARRGGRRRDEVVEVVS